MKIQKIQICFFQRVRMVGYQNDPKRNILRWIALVSSMHYYEVNELIIWSKLLNLLISCFGRVFGHWRLFYSLISILRQIPYVKWKDNGINKWNCNRNWTFVICDQINMHELAHWIVLSKIMPISLRHSSQINVIDFSSR